MLLIFLRHIYCHNDPINGHDVAISSPCPCFQEGVSDEQTELEIVQDNMATLSTSFATLMEQKTKMEATYQADKKKVMVR